jgi:hypothetical protein
VIIARNGKGGKDRTTLLPQPLCETLRDWITAVRQTCLTRLYLCASYRAEQSTLYRT